MKETKKKLEFSKVVAGIIILVLVAFSIWACVEYYMLAKLAITCTSEYVTPTLPDASLAIACISSILGVFASYCLYQFGLKNSLNKNGLEIDGLTGCTRRIQETPYMDCACTEFSEIPQQITNNDSEDEIKG